MNGLNDKHDKAFQKLFQHALEENPSSGFTQKIMERIEIPVQESKIRQHPYFFNTLLWIALPTAFLSIGFGVVYYFNIQVAVEPAFKMLMPVFENLRNSFSLMFSSFSISPLTIAIFLGTFLLIIIDRLLRFRGFKNNISSFLY